MKVLVCGDVHAGKSTLINRLIPLFGKAPCGYITVRIGDTVYLYDRAAPPADVHDAAVIMQFDADGLREKRPELMDSLGVSYLRGIPAGSLVILDEIGTLESASPLFQKAILDILSGDFDVLASVKAQNTDFLRRVRSHPDTELYIITPKNREELYAQLAEKINHQKLVKSC